MRGRRSSLVLLEAKQSAGLVPAGRAYDYPAVRVVILIRRPGEGAVRIAHVGALIRLTWTNRDCATRTPPTRGGLSGRMGPGRCGSTTSTASKAPSSCVLDRTGALEQRRRGTPQPHRPLISANWDGLDLMAGRERRRWSRPPSPLTRSRRRPELGRRSSAWDGGLMGRRARVHRRVQTVSGASDSALWRLDGSNSDTPIRLGRRTTDTSCSGSSSTVTAASGRSRRSGPPDFRRSARTRRSAASTPRTVRSTLDRHGRRNWLLQSAFRAAGSHLLGRCALFPEARRGASAFAPTAELRRSRSS